MFPPFVHETRGTAFFLSIIRSQNLSLLPSPACLRRVFCSCTTRPSPPPFSHFFLDVTSQGSVSSDLEKTLIKATRPDNDPAKRKHVNLLLQAAEHSFPVYMNPKVRQIDGWAEPSSLSLNQSTPGSINQSGNKITINKSVAIHAGEGWRLVVFLPPPPASLPSLPYPPLAP